MRVYEYLNKYVKYNFYVIYSVVCTWLFIEQAAQQISDETKCIECSIITDYVFVQTKSMW